MPTGNEDYSEKLTILIVDSIQRIVLDASGTGLMPEIELNQNVLEMGPILQYSSGITSDIIISNPSKLSLEFYSLDFDDTYLAEEEILRNQKGFDKFGNLVLPPRPPGGLLPSELYPKPEMVNPDEPKEEVQTKNISEEDPVQTAVAKYLGIDMTPEGQAARNRLGISVIIWGAPFSGKTTIGEILSNFKIAQKKIEDQKCVWAVPMTMLTVLRGYPS